MSSGHPAKPDSSLEYANLAARLEEDLFARHGPMIGGAALHAALGYPSATAFRMALARDRVPIPVFPLDHRRGKFALV
ncbi:hypothetical protein FN976_07365, partial [Caenimonas sedimenti]